MKLPLSVDPVIREAFRSLEIDKIKSDGGAKSKKYGAFYDYGGAVYNVKHPDFGAKGDDSTDDTAAVQAAITAAGTNGGIVFFPEGVYQVDSLSITAPGNIVFQGSGRGRLTDGVSVIKSRSGSTVFDLASGSYRNIAWRDLAIRGNGGSGHGIHCRSTLDDKPFGLYMENCVIDQHGGKGFYDEKGVFESTFRYVLTSNCGSDHFDMAGGPALLWDSCRVWKLQAGTAGYRVRSGTGPTFISCNGVFKDLTAGGTFMIRLGDTNLTHATCVGCNFEDINGTAIYCLNGSIVDLTGCNVFRPQDTVDYVAIQQVGPTSSLRYGYISPTTYFADPFPAGNYKDSEPLHSSLNAFRFWVAHKDVQTFYDDTASVSRALEGPMTFAEMDELSSDPSAPAANKVRLYCKDNGSGKTTLVARFATGAVQTIATEP